MRLSDTGSVMEQYQCLARAVDATSFALNFDVGKACAKSRAPVIDTPHVDLEQKLALAQLRGIANRISPLKRRLYPEDVYHQEVETRKSGRTPVRRPLLDKRWSHRSVSRLAPLSYHRKHPLSGCTDDSTAWRPQRAVERSPQVGSGKRYLRPLAIKRVGSRSRQRNKLLDR